MLNVAAYLFTSIEDREDLRETLLARALQSDLRGTVLLAPEGINLFLAGPADDVRGFLDALRADPRFAALEAKESWSAEQPFGRMLVKLKNEIIRMDHPTVRPADSRAPSVGATTLRAWLDRGYDDNGREVVLLDTRNAFEVDYGTFAGAIDWRLDKFTEFPQAVAENRAALEGRTVVSFCTGGIRCEKAAIYMRDIGLTDVLQLEGGILTYFEEVGSAHYDGDCFVFDGREALTPELAVSNRPTLRR